MLLSYKFKNFMSFNEEVEFSLLAPKSKVKKRFPNHYVSYKNGCDVLKTAVVVGENAGGKSNFVSSFEYFKSFFAGTDAVEAYKDTVYFNNIKGKCPLLWVSAQYFEIEIIIDNKIYLYLLEFDSHGIIREELSVKNAYGSQYKTLLKVKREKLTFIDCNNKELEAKEECSEKNCERQLETKYDITISNLSKDMAALLKEIAKKQKQSGLFITKLAILGYKPAIQFTEWVKKQLLPETNVINYDIYMQLKKEEDNLRILNDERYLEIFKLIDYSIEKIDIDEEKPYTKTKVVRRNSKRETFARELVNDSSGVREFFAWAVQIFRVVYENAVVFADEMDRVLNPVLSDKVIAFINGKEHQGQFIFTTHNALHLNLKNFMKEQIYFVTKDVETLQSELYSLADFPEIRYETAKIYELYMKGILGGTVFE